MYVIQLRKNGVPRCVFLFVFEVECQVESLRVRDQIRQGQVKSVIEKLSSVINGDFRRVIT